MPDWLWIQNAVLPILGLGWVAFVSWGVYRTVNNWAERRHERLMASQGGLPSADLERLRAGLEAIEGIDYRLQELEERLDFAERVLARRQESARLAPGEER